MSRKGLSTFFESGAPWRSITMLPPVTLAILAGMVLFEDRLRAVRNRHPSLPARDHLCTFSVQGILSNSGLVSPPSDRFHPFPRPKFGILYWVCTSRIVNTIYLSPFPFLPLSYHGRRLPASFQADDSLRVLACPMFHGLFPCGQVALLRPQLLRGLLHEPRCNAFPFFFRGIL